MSATSVTGIGQGAAPSMTSSELNASINNLNIELQNMKARFPTAEFTEIEVVLGAEEEPTMGYADITLKNHLDEFTLSVLRRENPYQF